MRRDLLIGLCDNRVDIIVDPYTGATSGLVRVVAYLLADLDLPRPESFCVIDDAVTT